MTSSIKVSSFLPIDQMLEHLEAGMELNFKEYDDLNIPPAYIKHHNEHGIVFGSKESKNIWNKYHPSLFESALNDQIERIMTWNYTYWFGNNDNQFNETLHEDYSLLVTSYRSLLSKQLRKYSGIDRIIECSATFAHFLADESTLLECFEFQHIWNWQYSFSKRSA